MFTNKDVLKPLNSSIAPSNSVSTYRLNQRVGCLELILASTFYWVCQCNISFSEKPWDNYEILVFWVHIFQSRKGDLVSTFFALIIQVPNALSTVPLWITNFCLCIHVTQRVAGRFRPGLKLLCKTRYRLLHHIGTIICEVITKSSLSN